MSMSMSMVSMATTEPFLSADTRPASSPAGPVGPMPHPSVGALSFSELQWSITEERLGEKPCDGPEAEAAEEAPEVEAAEPAAAAEPAVAEPQASEPEEVPSPLEAQQGERGSLLLLRPSGESAAFPKDVIK